MKTETLLQIEKTLLEIVKHQERPEVVHIQLDTAASSNPEENIIPYLNIYGSKVYSRHNFDDAMQTAVEKEEFGYIMDVLDIIEFDEFSIGLVSLYPKWPNDQQAGDKVIVEKINKMIKENKEEFKHVKKIFFNYADSLDWIKFIDLPA